MFKDDAATLLEADAIVAYLAYIVLQSMCAIFCRPFRSHSYTVGGFLSVSTEVWNAFDNGGLLSENDIEKYPATVPLGICVMTLSLLSCPKSRN